GAPCCTKLSRSRCQPCSSETRERSSCGSDAIRVIINGKVRSTAGYEIAAKHRTSRPRRQVALAKEGQNAKERNHSDSTGGDVECGGAWGGSGGGAALGKRGGGS